MWFLETLHRAVDQAQHTLDAVLTKARFWHLPAHAKPHVPRLAVAGHGVDRLAREVTEGIAHGGLGRVDHAIADPARKGRAAAPDGTGVAIVLSGWRDPYGGRGNASKILSGDPEPLPGNAWRFGKWSLRPSPDQSWPPTPDRETAAEYAGLDCLASVIL